MIIKKGRIYRRNSGAYVVKCIDNKPYPTSWRYFTAFVLLSTNKGLSGVRLFSNDGLWEELE